MGKKMGTEASMENVLVVEDTASLREALCAVLSNEGYRVTGAGSAEEGLELFRENEFSVVLTDLKLPNKSGLDFIRETSSIDRSIPVIVMTAYGNIEIAVEAMQLGARDFITKPFDPAMLCDLLIQLAEHRQIIDRSLGRTKRKRRKILTQCTSMEVTLGEARKVAPLSTPVLILGESGTGKELLAQFIHQQSQRHEEPFVPVNCASMPSELLESEFFGHEVGAFTGATESRQGLFEIADNGTIFLDEIGNMPYELQVKLLRTLQESEVKRIGSTQVNKVNVRVISATNCDIEHAVKSGSFRDDLYYRLGVFVISLPPLRERIGDIELLANYYVKTLSQELGDEGRKITPNAIKLLESYHWPGNIRELENVIERALIFTKGPLDADAFELGPAMPNHDSGNHQTLPEIAQEACKEAEIEAIVATLRKTRGNKSQAARLLGVSYKTLLNKIKAYDLNSIPLLKH